MTLTEQGIDWHLFIFRGVIETRQLDKAAEKVREGQAGFVHYHKQDESCVDKCEFIEGSEAA